MISHVLDTCALLDLAGGKWKAGAASDELIRARDPVVLSVTVWEIARKLRIGKLLLPCAQSEVLAFVLAVCDRHRLRLIPLTGEICEAAEMLPPHHQDPFDRMILACAISAGSPVFTVDAQFGGYPCRLLSYR